MMATVTGTNENDLFISNLEQTTYDGREGSDTVDYRNAGGFVSIDLAAGHGPFSDTYISIENVRGSSFGDLLKGDGGANTLIGRGGTDTLSGGGGNDTLYADASGTLDAGTDRDLLDGGAGDDVIWAGSDDYVNGDSGFDTLLLSYAAAPSTYPPGYGVTNGYDLDTIDMLNQQFGSYRNIELISHLWGSAFSDTIKLATQPGSITVEAGSGNDVVFGRDSTVTIYGQDGFDQLFGSSTGDVLSGGADGDRIIGNGGGDWLDGGEGQDIISTEMEMSFDNFGAQDHVFGGAGADQIYAGYGDIVDGGEGFDTVYISYIGGTTGISNGDTATLFAGQPLVAGGGTLISVESFATMALTSFNDSMVFGNQDAKVTAYGWHGDDTLIAQQANVVFYGGTGNDLLVGGLADDFLSGEDGNDRIVGGRGFDSFSGGAGSDRFIFVNVDDKRDYINDFEVQADVIDLSAIDADLTASGDQAFTFIGGASFSGLGGEVRGANENGSYVLLADVNGDKVADFIIDLGVAPALSATNFVL
ncbi:MAG TPA: calcium-binding protein [Sphingomicrobium sp.]|jgi:Ca2+-binding RTX toxin-like protein